MAASDVFVMASRWEGLGLVFLEAMATSRPVLSTNVSAIPEVVVDGETGRLVAPDDPSAMAGAMVDLAGDPELRARFGAAGRARVIDRFGLDRMVDDTIAVYRDVTGASEAAARSTRRSGLARAGRVAPAPDGDRGPRSGDGRPASVRRVRCACPHLLDHRP